MLGFFSVQDAFFCKVQDILHRNFSGLVEEEKKLQKNLEEEEKKLEKNLEEKKQPKMNEMTEKIVKNLNVYISRRNVRIFTEGSTQHLSARAAILSVCLLLR